MGAACWLSYLEDEQQMKIAVIGAGLAGITAAAELQARGFKVDVFEKSRGAGGRLATKRLDWAKADIGAQYFTVRDPAFAEVVANWQTNNLVARWRFTPHKLADGKLVSSPDDTPRYIAVPGMTAMAKANTHQLNIRYQCRIQQLVGRRGTWTLQDERGVRHGAYRWVVLSQPAAQSHALLKTHSQAERLTQQIPKDQMLPCWALVLATEGVTDPSIAGIFGDETVSWISRLNSKPVRQAPPGCDDLWLMHFGARWSAQKGRDYAYRLPGVGAALLQQLLDTPLRVRHSYVHYWRYAKLRASHRVAEPIVAPDQKLAVIGDWTHGGRVEGAYLSAVNLVQQLEKIAS